MLRILVGFLTEGHGPDVEDFNELNESTRADRPPPQRAKHAFGTTQKLSLKMTLLVELPRQTHPYASIVDTRMVLCAIGTSNVRKC